MPLFEHPGDRLDRDVARELSALAWEAERTGDLHARQLELIYRNKWFKMFVPQRYGGLGLTLPEALRIEEALSWADGSTGWVVTLCSGAGWFVGHLDPSVAAELFHDERLCVAGNGNPSGTAEITRDGYLINGSWPFASGALHATAFTVTCVVMQHGQKILGADGSPRTASFILHKDEVSVQKTWNAMGMVATASHSFSVDNVAVPLQRCFLIDPRTAALKDPVFHYPFLQLSEGTLAVNISGMTIRFLDLAAELIVENDPPSNGMNVRTLMLHEHIALLNDVRKLFFEYVDESWKQLLFKGAISDATLRQVSSICQSLVRCSRTCVNVLYPLCGLESTSTESEINRVWRNIHTSIQHSLFRNRANT